MSNPQSPAYREGIWEIRETTITALLPEGARVLQIGDIEFIRLQSGMENGVSFCDAFIKPRESDRPYPVGRYPSGKEGICKVLGQFAEWNGVPLLGAPGPQGMEEVPRVGFDSEPDANLKMSFDPQRQADPDEGFDAQQEYDAGQGFDSRQTWWQWTFNPINPNFRKTMIILSVIAVLIILLGASGVFSGIRMQSVSGPGIVAIYFLLRAMKNRKPKDRHGANNPPRSSSWDPDARQPGPWETGSGTSSDIPNDSAADQGEKAHPNDSTASANESADKVDS